MILYAFFFLVLAVVLFWLNLKVRTTPSRATTFIFGWLAIATAILLAVMAIFGLSVIA